MRYGEQEQAAIAHMESSHSHASGTIPPEDERDMARETQAEINQFNETGRATESSDDATEVYAGSYAGLLPLLQRLDKRLAAAITAADQVFAARAAGDLYRGLAISPADVVAALGRVPGEPLLLLRTQVHAIAEATNSLSVRRLLWLQSTYGLSDFDLDVIVIALAPEVDLRYERLYAYVQDDVTKKRPTVDLALNLLCSCAEEKIEERTRFAADAPLVQHGLIHLLADPHQDQPPLLARYLKLDEQIVRLLLGDDSLDPRLAPFCRLKQPSAILDDQPLNPETKRALDVLTKLAREERLPLRLYFQGPSGSGKSQTAEAMAHEIGVRFLSADLAKSPATLADFEAALVCLLREASFRDAVLYLYGLDALREEEQQGRYQCLLRAVAECRRTTLLSGTQDWIPSVSGPAGVTVVSFAMPRFEERRAQWVSSLAQSGASLAPAELDALSARFRLTPKQIDHAVASACNLAIWRAASEYATQKPNRVLDQKPDLRDFFRCAREQTGHDLAGMARKIEPKYKWDDIVLPEEIKTQLKEVCQRVTYQHQVLNNWGFGNKLSMGKGVNVLFSGSSGTGKTMAAEVIASELGLDLYKIDLSQIMSKYIGETAKKIDAIFKANVNGILFFDEADALFGKRSEVKDAHDRYANIDVSYLLQKMDECKGIAILATNLHDNMDQAFLRRLAFCVHFPFPDEAHRRRIWERAWPREAPLGKNVDLDVLASEFKLSGGNIKNIALAAAFLGATEGVQINAQHVLHATSREYQKLGKTLARASDGRQGAAE